MESHRQEGGDDSNPVQIVGDDGAVGGRVVPAEDGVEDAPAAAAVELRTATLPGGRHHQYRALCLVSKTGLLHTYIDVPNDLVNIIGTRAISQLLSVTANDVVPFLLLKVANSTGEQTGRDEVEQTGRNHEEDLHVGGRTTPASKASRTISRVSHYEEGTHVSCGDSRVTSQDLLVQNVPYQGTQSKARDGR